MKCYEINVWKENNCWRPESYFIWDTEITPEEALEVGKEMAEKDTTFFPNEKISAIHVWGQKNGGYFYLLAKKDYYAMRKKPTDEKQIKALKNQIEQLEKVINETPPGDECDKLTQKMFDLNYELALKTI